MKSISVVWPWTTLGLTIEKIVQEALMLGCGDICIRATDGNALYGVGAATKLRWGGRTQFDLERAAKAAGLTTSIWCAVYLIDWAGEAAAIKKAVDFYNPPVVYLDAEGTAKKNIANLGAFLRALGRLPCKVVLQSYRMAQLHREMVWSKWYSYKDPQGRYVIDGLGHQLYPIGVAGGANWIADFKRSIESHQVECEKVGRPDMPWYPTLPAFIGGSFEGVAGWSPRPQDLLAGVAWLDQNLGDRLKGLNFWSLDRHLVKLPALAKTISEISLRAVSVGAPPAPIVAPTLDQRVTNIEAEARAHGWSL